MKRILERLLGRSEPNVRQELHLPIHGLFRLGGQCAVCVEVGSGLIWATVEGEDRDLLLSSGARQRLRGKNMVLEALDGPSDVSLSQ